MKELNARHTPEEAFIDALGRLGRADLARLRRNAGNALEDARDVLDLFYRILPRSVPPCDHDRYFLIATLYPLAGGGKGRNFGATLRRVRAATDSPSVDRRFTALLDADERQLPFRLRQLVRLAKAHDADVDWLQLLRDLRRWSQPGRRVQREWAMAYFDPTPTETDEALDVDTRA